MLILGLSIYSSYREGWAHYLNIKVVYMKYVGSASACVFALILFSFNPLSKGIGTDCDYQLYYFQVQSSVLMECSEVSTLMQIVMIPELFNASQPNEVPFVFSNNTPFMCDDSGELACALGFSRDQIELVDGYWRPKVINGIFVPKKCCIRMTGIEQ